MLGVVLLEDLLHATLIRARDMTVLGEGLGRTPLELGKGDRSVWVFVWKRAWVSSRSERVERPGKTGTYLESDVIHGEQ